MSMKEPNGFGDSIVDISCWSYIIIILKPKRTTASTVVFFYCM